MTAILTLLAASYLAWLAMVLLRTPTAGNPFLFAGVVAAMYLIGGGLTLRAADFVDPGSDWSRLPPRWRDPRTARYYRAVGLFTLGLAIVVTMLVFL